MVESANQCNLYDDSKRKMTSCTSISKAARAASLTLNSSFFLDFLWVCQKRLNSRQFIACSSVVWYFESLPLLTAIIRVLQKLSSSWLNISMGAISIALHFMVKIFYGSTFYCSHISFKTFYCSHLSFKTKYLHEVPFVDCPIWNLKGFLSNSLISSHWITIK